MGGTIFEKNSANLRFPDLNLIRPDIDALIFDLDGTILDSMTLWNQVDIEFLSKRGFEVTHDYTEYVKRVSIDNAALYTKERFNLKESPEEIKNEWNKMVFDAYLNSVKIFDGVFEYIKDAANMGYKIAAATALNRVNAEAALKSNGIYDFFSCLITLEDLGTHVDKSTPDVYLLTSESINVAPSRCLIFEDVEIAIKGAILGGFKTTAVYDSIGAGSSTSWENMCAISDYQIGKWGIYSKG